jgi:tRNA(Ile)-lysidine synthase
VRGLDPSTTTSLAAESGGPAGRAGLTLDQRLADGAAQPLAVAYSGGGDSLALLIAAQAWAAAHGRTLIALTVDHRLQPQSPGWTAQCAATARRLGVGFQALAWEGAKPSRGLPAAARAARHRLLAEAARTAGARVLLMGHTADDTAEARAMRAAGSNTPDPREWSPSPVWPEGRGLFILRPLLACGRADLRQWLAERGETWIDDPANADPRYARPRARAALAAGAVMLADAQSWPEAAGLARASRAEPWGAISISRKALGEASAEAARAFLSAACLCAGGGPRPPRGEPVRRLADRLVGDAPLVASLAGARVEADRTMLRFMREAGEAARGGLAELALSPGAAAVWDGRFEIVVERPGLTVAALAGRSRRLSPAARLALSQVPAGARGGLPVILDANGDVTCALLEQTPGVFVRPLGHDRLLAACGTVSREPAS